MKVAQNRHDLTQTSRLAVPPGLVWDRTTSVAGIRDEMRPWIRMTMPPGFSGIESITVGTPLGRSWLLLFGVLPFDFDEICLVRLEPGRHFHERSRMLTQRVWEHERTITAEPGGCTITDHVAWEPRGPLPARWLAPVIGWFFRHRHRRLRRHFGA